MSEATKPFEENTPILPPINRRKFLKISGAAASGALVGWTTWMTRGIVTEPVVAVSSLVEFQPQILAIYARREHSEALSQTAHYFPKYPLNPIRENPDHQTLERFLQTGIATAARNSHGSLKLTWNPPEYTSIEKLRPTMPNINNGYTDLDELDFMSATPVLTREFLSWSTMSFENILEAKLPVKSYFQEQITPDLIRKQDEAIKEYVTRDEELTLRYSSGLLTTEQTMGLKVENLDRKNTRIRQISLPIVSHLEEVRAFIVDNAQRQSTAQNPSIALAYYIERNGENLFHALVDTLIFYKLTTRNSFETGIYNGDTLEAPTNIDWLKQYIVDTSFYANWAAMPTNYLDFVPTSYDKSVTTQTSAQYPFGPSLHSWPIDNIRVENQIGTLYHLLNDLVLSALLPWQIVALGSIERIRVVASQGPLKIARESAGLAELPQAIATLQGFKPR